VAVLLLLVLNMQFILELEEYIKKIDILFPIFDKFNLNGTKYLDYLAFKRVDLQRQYSFTRTKIKIYKLIKKLYEFQKNGF
jgi:hypothetical protein